MLRTWKQPPRIKILEALGALADQRVTLTDSGAIVSSSSGNKRYTVIYNQSTDTITSNDNGSYWKGYLGYPALAVLMLNGRLPFNAKLASLLAGIPWKQWNENYKYDYSQVESLVRKRVGEASAAALVKLDMLVKEIESSLREGALPSPGDSTEAPPAGW